MVIIVPADTRRKFFVHSRRSYGADNIVHGICGISCQVMPGEECHLRNQTEPDLQ